MKNAKAICNIAREAGVSASTVSRVANGKPGISGKIRQRLSEVSRTAAGILLAALEEQKPAKKTLIRTDIIERETT